MSSSPDRRDILQTRRKVKKACIPCQNRKRKCDGLDPCSLCLRYEYDCRYAQTTTHTKATPPARSPVDSKGLTPAVPRVPPSAAASGVAFALSVGSSNSVQKTSNLTLGWNIGERDKPESNTPVTPTNDLLSLLPLYRLRHEVNLYFATVGPLFPLISSDLANSLIRDRYPTNSSPGSEPLLDSVLAGLAALGVAFSKGPSLDSRQLADLANRCMSQCNERDPTHLDVIASALRTLWLRTVSYARPCWLESCRLVHLLEATGLHSTAADNETAQDLYWTARLINMWVAFELGRSHVEFSDVDNTIPPEITRRHPSNVLGLYAFTRTLSPVKSSDITALESTFAQVETFDCHGNDSLALSRAVLAMAIYRKIYVQFPGSSNQLKVRVISVGMQGLQSVQRLLLEQSPWWHLLNLPLQLLCLLLVLESYSEVPQVLDTLRHVQQVHNTESVATTLAFAENIVAAVQEKLDMQSRALRQSLSKQSMTTMSADGLPNWTTSADSEALAASVVTMDQLAWDLFPNSATAAFDLTALDQLPMPNLYPTA